MEEAQEKRSRRLSNTLKQVGRTVRLDVRIKRLSKILKASRQDQSFKRADNSPLYIVYICSVCFRNFYCSVVSVDCSYYFRKFHVPYFTSEKLCLLDYPSIFNCIR